MALVVGSLDLMVLLPLLATVVLIIYAVPNS